MSWSSEFEPDLPGTEMKGRSISFKQEELPSRPESQSTQDLARNTLQLSPPVESTGRPSGGVVVATLLLAGIAMVAAILYLASVGPESSTSTETSAALEPTSPEPAAPAVIVALDNLVDGLDTTDISFEVGTAQPTAAGSQTLAAVKRSLQADPTSNVAFEVRTYSEESPAANHKLSEKQADALSRFLLEGSSLGTEQVAVRGLGSGDIDSGGQLSHFVTISVPKASRSAQNSISQTSGFALSSPADGWAQAAPNSSALQAVAKLLASTEPTPVEVSIHTFDSAPAEPSPTESQATLGNLPVTNEAFGSMAKLKPEARQLGEAIEDFLGAQGVDSSLLTVKLSGPTTARIPTGITNIVSLSRGEKAALTGGITRIPDIRFWPGKAELEPTGQQSLNQVAELVGNSSLQLILDVHTFSQQTAEDNLELSQAQAFAAAEYLSARGMPAERIRVVGSGNSNQFDESGSLTITVLSIAD